MTALREAFERDGVVRVPGAIADVVAMRACVQERIASLAFVEVAGALRPALGTELALWAIGRDAAFAALPGAFAGAVERVFGPGVWRQPMGELGGLAMPNLPCASAWRVCDAAWHVDEPSHPGQAAGRVLIGYALLDHVAADGGATIVLPGSHRRLAALADERGASVTTDVALTTGVRPPFLSVSGEAGDVVLLDPRCLHTTSANVSPRPRLLMRLTGVRV